MVNYKTKYLKYKLKYLNLKNKLTGGMGKEEVSKEEEEVPNIELDREDVPNINLGENQITLTIIIDSGKEEIIVNKSDKIADMINTICKKIKIYPKQIAFGDHIIVHEDDKDIPLSDFGIEDGANLTISDSVVLTQYDNEILKAAIKNLKWNSAY